MLLVEDVGRCVTRVVSIHTPENKYIFLDEYYILDQDPETKEWNFKQISKEMCDTILKLEEERYEG